MTGAQARRRFLVLTALRWFPVGLWVPITVLLPLDRGLSLAQVGAVAAVQGFVVLALELPTGGLSDSWGRRPVLVLAGIAALLSTAVFVVADSVAMFVLAYALQGVFRALDSGPLEAWYVDAALRDEPGVRLERTLGAGGTVLGLAVASGALVTGGLVAWIELPAVPRLVSPLLVGLLVQLVGLVAVLLLVRESAWPRVGLWFALRGTPAAIGGCLRLVRRSRVLAALIAVELFWGFGMVTWESLMPVRLRELLGASADAAAVTGPANAAAWLASAVGAALVPLLAGRFGLVASAVALRIAQAVAVLGMALLAGPAGMLTGFLAAQVLNGASTPVHMTLVHRQVAAEHRATAVSMNSMAAQSAFAIGLLVLTALAADLSVGAAMIVGAVVLAVAAPLYLAARRAPDADKLQPCPTQPGRRGSG